MGRQSHHTGTGYCSAATWASYHSPFTPQGLAGALQYGHCVRKVCEYFKVKIKSSQMWFHSYISHVEMTKHTFGVQAQWSGHTRSGTSLFNAQLQREELISKKSKSIVLKSWIKEHHSNKHRASVDEDFPLRLPHLRISLWVRIMKK